MVIGYLLDVSGSVREALETGRSDEHAIERRRAVLCATLQLDRAERGRNPYAFMFVGVFGLNRDAGCPPGVDLCSVIAALLGSPEDHRTGHEILIEQANQNNLAHITEYIRTKLTEDELIFWLSRLCHWRSYRLRGSNTGEDTAEDDVVDHSDAITSSTCYGDCKNIR